MFLIDSTFITYKFIKILIAASDLKNPDRFKQHLYPRNANFEPIGVQMGQQKFWNKLV